ncbi:type I polyketide synthase [Actinomadura rugatobispora]|uniref:Type I polyketide synthase n=1 Tax=Actinomadura rugatobispora TaxID=1994 RepID=A0ABW1AHB8_9ACTN
MEGDEPIAVIGLSARLPGAAGPAELWRLLRTAEHAVTEVPADRWDAGAFYDPDPAAPGKANTRWGGFIDGVAGFDAGFFGVSPREAVAMDPQQRLVLELGWEALEDARLAPDTLTGSRAGVFVGAIWDDYATLLHRRGPAAITRHTMTGLHRGIIANRLSYVLGLTGPSLVVDTGQSSSLVAVHMAAESLRRGESSLALAGGVNLTLAPDSTVGAAKFGGLSPDGRCFVFDARANGFVRGEGGGLVVLKRLSDATADGDEIRCVIRGGAVNNDGGGPGLTAPDVAAQEEVLREAYRRAGVAPGEVQYVELHGTGTRRGDPVEAAALGAVPGAARPSGRPLPVGSVKTNVGHLEGAAGIAGLLKVVLSLWHGELPASLNFESPNPDIPLESLNLRVPTATEPWPGQGTRLAGVSSFGVGGTNCHVVLSRDVPSEAADEPVRTPMDAVPWVVSGQGAEGLRAQAARLVSFVQDRPELDPADVGLSLATTRAGLSHRAAVVGADRDGLLAALASLAEGDPSAEVVESEAATRGRTVFVFPGQGSQWPGMADELLAWSPVFAGLIADCESALAPFVEWKLTEVLRGDPGAPSLERVDVVQPALFAVMVALAGLWRSHGVEPDAVVGHSQGEIAAACVAGALSLEDAARIVALRSRLVGERLAGTGAMMSVALPAGEAAARIEHWPDRLSVAAVNGPRAVVVSGDPEAVAEFGKTCDGEGVWNRSIAVDYASHSAHVERIGEELIDALGPLSATSGELAFHSTVTGERLDTAALDTGYWLSNLRETVRFDAATRDLVRGGHDVFIEVSPHPVLVSGVNDIAEDAGREVLAVGSLRRGDGGARRFLASLAQAWAGGAAVDWDGVFAGSGARRVGLPTYAFQRRRYWPAPEAPGTGAPSVPQPEGAGAEEEPDEPQTTTLADRLRGLSEAERETVVLDTVRRQAAIVLGHESASEVAAGLSFKELGFDSLSGVELRRRLVRATGLRLPSTLIYDHPRPAALAEYLRTALVPDSAPTAAGLVDELDRWEAALSTAVTTDDERAAIAGRLRALLSRWDSGPGNGGGGPGGDLESSTADELLTIIKTEFGGP